MDTAVSLPLPSTVEAPVDMATVSKDYCNSLISNEQPVPAHTGTREAASPPVRGSIINDYYLYHLKRYGLDAKESKDKNPQLLAGLSYMVNPGAIAATNNTFPDPPVVSSSPGVPVEKSPAGGRQKQTGNSSATTTSANEQVLRVSAMAYQCMCKLQYFRVLTRLEDWKDGGLPLKHMLAILEGVNKIVAEFEISAAPSGWKCVWDSATCSYFYQNTSTRESSWKYPTHSLMSPAYSKLSEQPLEQAEGSNKMEAVQDGAVIQVRQKLHRRQRSGDLYSPKNLAACEEPERPQVQLDRQQQQQHWDQEVSDALGNMLPTPQEVEQRVVHGMEDMGGDNMLQPSDKLDYAGSVMCVATLPLEQQDVTESYGSQVGLVASALSQLQPAQLAEPQAADSDKSVPQGKSLEESELLLRREQHQSAAPEASTHVVEVVSGSGDAVIADLDDAGSKAPDVAEAVELSEYGLELRLLQSGEDSNYADHSQVGLQLKMSTTFPRRELQQHTPAGREKDESRCSKDSHKKSQKRRHDDCSDSESDRYHTRTRRHSDSERDRSLSPRKKIKKQSRCVSRDSKDSHKKSQKRGKNDEKDKKKRCSHHSGSKEHSVDDTYKNSTPQNIIVGKIGSLGSIQQLGQEKKAQASTQHQKADQQPQMSLSLESEGRSVLEEVTVKNSEVIEVPTIAEITECDIDKVLPLGADTPPATERDKVLLTF